MKIILETPSGLTMQQHLNKYFKTLSKDQLTPEKIEEVATAVRSVLKQCTLVLRDNDGELYTGKTL